MPTLQDTKPFVYPLGIDIGSTTVKLPFWVRKMNCSSLIMNVILQIFKIHLLLFFR